MRHCAEQRHTAGSVLEGPCFLHRDTIEAVPGRNVRLEIQESFELGRIDLHPFRKEVEASLPFTKVLVLAREHPQAEPRRLANV